MPVKLQSKSKIIADLGLDKNGRVTRYLTNNCKKHMDKYVPYDTGTLAVTAIATSNQIIYDQEYAEYVYDGISKSGKPLNYQLDKHPLATSHWDKKMWSAEKDNVLAEVQAYVNRGG